jgi:SAM-dependent methyltransferase
MDIEEIWKRAQEYALVFEQRKSAAAPPGFPWYPHDTVSNFWVLTHLLEGPNRRLLELAEGAPVADIGAADGFSAFFLETLGCSVDLIDNGPTNFNGLRGARLLKDTLESKVEIHEIDLDTQFRLPRQQYGLVLFLGILYHLKNPMFALESLARSARYCLLSTRVARYAGSFWKRRIASLPVAYLVDADETHNDATNYWIFSEAGLRRICHRTGWDVVHFTSIGDRRRSNPNSPKHDERAFLLLKSRNF